jgi:hypothetical protein
VQRLLSRATYNINISAVFESIENSDKVFIASSVQLGCLVPLRGAVVPLVPVGRMGMISLVQHEPDKYAGDCEVQEERHDEGL